MTQCYDRGEANLQSRHLTYQRTKPVRRSAPKVSRASASVFARLTQKTKYADPALTENWPSIAGGDIAALCRPGRLTGHPSARTLELYAPSGAAAAQVQMFAGEIKTRVNRYLGPNAISRIVVVQSAGPKPKEETSADSAGQPLGQALASFRAAVKRRNGEK